MVTKNSLLQHEPHILVFVILLTMPYSCIGIYTFLNPCILNQIIHKITSQPLAVSLVSSTFYLYLSLPLHPAAFLVETFILLLCITVVGTRLVFLLIATYSLEKALNIIIHDMYRPCLKSFPVFQSAHKKPNCPAMAQRLCTVWLLATSATQPFSVLSPPQHKPKLLSLRTFAPADVSA